MVMQSAIGHQKHTAPRYLAVDDSADIQARLPDEVSAQLHDDLGLRQARLDAWHQGGEVSGDRSQIDRPLAREVGNAQAAADVQQSHGGRRIRGETDREFDAFLLCFDDRFGAKILGAAEYVETVKHQRQRGERAQQFGHPLSVDAELLRSAAHLHP